MQSGLGCVAVGYVATLLFASLSKGLTLLVCKASAAAQVYVNTTFRSLLINFVLELLFLGLFRSRCNQVEQTPSLQLASQASSSPRARARYVVYRYGVARRGQRG